MAAHTTTTRLLAGLLMTGALVLTACSGTSTASPEDEGAVSETTKDMDTYTVEAPTGLIHHDISHGVNVVETLTPTHNRVITPAGIVFIDSVEVAQLAPIEELDLDMSEHELDINDAPTDVRPADGEVFRVIDFRFIPHLWDEYDDQRTASITLDSAGQQHIVELEHEHSERLLVSIPEHEDAQFVVSSEGHDQYIDALTGERIEQEDDPAAAFYRDISNKNINHAFDIADDSVLIQRAVDNNTPDSEAVISYDLRLREASLTGWTPDHGWAAAGQAWLAIDWSYDFAAQFDNSMGAGLNQTHLTLSAALEDGTTVEDTITNENWSNDEVRSVIAIPVDTTTMALSFAGSTDFVMDDLAFAVAAGEHTTLEVSTDAYEVGLSEQ